jgi:hypothetical protein
VLISTLVPKSDSERFSAASGYFYPVIPAQAGIQEIRRTNWIPALPGVFDSCGREAPGN